MKLVMRASPNRRRRLVRRAAFILGSLVSLGLAASWIVAGRLIAPVPRAIGDPPWDLPAEIISLKDDSGRTVAGWHLSESADRGVVVLLHPIRGSRLSMLRRARLLRAHGYSIVMIDLQAHGESPGDHITIGHLERRNVTAAVEFARRQHPGERIGVIGVSLGGASALLAAPSGIDALILESVYPDIRNAVHNRVAARLGVLSSIPASLLLMQLRPRLGIDPGQLRPIDHLSRIECPVLLMSGRDDRHTTESETRTMFAAAHEPKELWLVPGAGHVDLFDAAPEEYARRITAFLEEHMRPGSSSASQSDTP